jgi:hypothetical protein
MTSVIHAGAPLAADSHTSRRIRFGRGATSKHEARARSPLPGRELLPAAPASGTSIRAPSVCGPLPTALLPPARRIMPPYGLAGVPQVARWRAGLGRTKP